MSSATVCTSHFGRLRHSYSPPPSGREAPPAHQHQAVTLLALPQGRCATEWLLIL
eukprot:COSAG01_NODE_528_length_15893_cov_49.094846_8_plen_55_part_00